MPWTQLDDGFHDSPTVRALSLEAVGLLVKAMTWSARHLTDGLIPFSILRDLSGHPRSVQRLLKELCEIGVLREVSGTTGYSIEGFPDAIPKKADVETRREAARNRKRIQRKQEAVARHARTSAAKHGLSEGSQP